jgi:hypothetical protein
MSAALLQAGIGAGSALAGYFLAKEQTKLQRESQRHRNAILKLNSNLKRNALELQEIDARNINRDIDKQLQLQSMQAKAAGEVSSAAAGVSGGSVEAAMRGLERNAMFAQAARMRNTSTTFRKLGQQRRNINVGEILGEDRTVIPGPSVGSLLLSMGTAAVDAYGTNTQFANPALNKFFEGRK